MIWLWKWLRRQFNPCPHDGLGKLWFRIGGRDYQRCLHCGRLVLTKLQLGEFRYPPWGEQVGLVRSDPAAIDLVLRNLEDE